MGGTELGLGLLGILGPLGRCWVSIFPAVEWVSEKARSRFLVPWFMSQLCWPLAPILDTPYPSLGARDGLRVPSRTLALLHHRLPPPSAISRLQYCLIHVSLDG